MSVFGSIMSAIFGSSAAAKPAQSTTKTTSDSGQGAGAPPTVPAQNTSAPMANVDVEAVLTQRAAQKKEKLNWRQSIVDLMKLLDLDSSLAARKQLAQELHYTGDTNDSATMNIWLHKQVMLKLAENGGKVPADLVH